MSLQPRWPMALAAALVVALLGGEASAQLTPAQKQEMRQHYERATRAYDVQKYSEAIDEYQKAYEIGGDPAMLYNIGQAHRLNDQLPDAVRFYRRYLQRSPNARNREDVERKIAELEKTIEDRRRAAAATMPPPLPVTPPPSSTSPSTSTTRPPPFAGTARAPARTPQPVAPAGAEAGMSATRLTGIVLLAVGGAALVTAGVTGKLAANKGDELSDASNNRGTFDPDVESAGKTLNTVAIVSAIAGAGAAVAGVVLVLVSRETPSAEPRAEVAPILGFGTVGASAVLRF